MALARRAPCLAHKEEMDAIALHQYKHAQDGWFETSGHFDNEYATSTEHILDQQIYRSKLNFISEYIAYG